MEFLDKIGLARLWGRFSERLNTHTGNKSNPHGVTVAQIGAAAASHTHAATDITSGILPVVRGGTGASTAAAARASLGTWAPVSALVSVPYTGWSLSGGVYKQTVSCSVAASSMKWYPIIGLYKSTDVSAAALEKTAFALVERVETGAGSLTLTCGAVKPAVTFRIMFMGGIA